MRFVFATCAVFALAGCLEWESLGGPGALTLAEDTEIVTGDEATIDPPVAGVTIATEDFGPGAQPVTVLQVDSLVVPAAVTVRVTGEYPLVIRSGGDVEIYGILDISGDSGVSGPGAIASGPSVGSVGVGRPEGGDRASGSGGGGHAEAGGNGGATEDVLGGSGGSALSQESLVGGSAGGQHLESCPSGGGGGAVLLETSASVIIGVQGGINAGGGGGHNGCECWQTNRGGAGGGAGGMIRIVAAEMDNAGILAANGGSGGGGCSSNMRGDPDVSGNHGHDGELSLTPAQGGPVYYNRVGFGGDGGALDSGPGDGGSDQQGGGGGGSAGRVIILTGQAASELGQISPAPGVTL